MYIPIKRTFSRFLATEGEAEDFEHWARYAGERRDPPGWPKLLALPMVVVLGEARSGKTEEFRQQAARLRADGKPAFFIPLDGLVTADLEDAVDAPGAAGLRAWLDSDKKGFFFFDSVDEARLVSTTALRGALGKVRRTLLPAAARAHVLISSRISDWMSPSVQAAILELHRALAAASRAAAKSKTGEGDDDVAEDESAQDDGLPAYQINPLEREQAVAIADGMGARDPEALWAAVVAGGYEAYATRPGDLEWLVRRWNNAGKLGGLADLTEAAVQHRLRETNESYVASGAALAEEPLRQATAALAAASVFSGRSQFQAGEGDPEASLIQPVDVLPAMRPLERQRVLGSAVFDAASLGRMRFHHRTIREYLAAEWVDAELEAGLPLARAIQFFVGTPFGERVLLRSRRGALCWLAARNTRVREYVVRHFPEMVMFEGDPTRWSQLEVIESFEAYLAKLAAGFWQDWWNDATEYARVARAVPASVLIEAIHRYRNAPSALARPFALVDHGQIRECAPAIFEIYRDETLRADVRTRALWALGDIATSEQRQRIKEDLVGRRLMDNDSRAAALTAVGIDGLSHGEFVDVLKDASPSEAFHSDPLAEAITRRMLPQLGHAQACALMLAISDAVPSHERRDLGSQHGEDRKPFAWLLEVFGDVFKRVLTTLPPGALPTPELIACAVLAERLNHTQFIDHGEFMELRPLVAAHPEIRKAFILAIGLDAPNSHVYSDLTGFSGLVQVDDADRDWIVEKAMDDAARPDERRVWFLAAMELTSAAYRGRELDETLRALAAGPDAVDRRRRLDEQREAHARGEQSRANYHQREQSRTADEAARNRRWVEMLRKEEPGIRAGTHTGALAELVIAARRGGDEFDTIDPANVAKEAGSELTAAFTEGLSKAYRAIEPPDLMSCIGKSAVPWAGLIGLASSNYELRNGLEAARVGEAEIVRAASFAVWSLKGEPARWIGAASEQHAEAIAAALMPVFEAELAQASDDHNTRVVSFALKAPQKLRAIFLERAVQLLRGGRVPSTYLQRSVCHALRDHPGAGPVIAEVAKARLATGVAETPPQLPGMWLAEWMCHDLVGAWAWLRGLVPRYFPDDAALATAFAAAAGDVERWAKNMPPTLERVQALKEMFRFVETSFPFERPGGLSEDPPNRLLNRLPNILQTLHTPAAHAALRELAGDHEGTHTGHWLVGLAEEMAAAQAERAAAIEPRDLRLAHDVFTRDARTEVELLDQVLARLEDVKTQIEQGPYSDRTLFEPGMDEEKLQKYLAARMDDTPVRHFVTRYRVSRESEVDRGNKPDLEVTAPAGRVPIEVKPVDKTRYSASSLAGTLCDQIATKYLAHGGSRHAVLAVFNLETKGWEIPDGPRRGTFADLIAYLQQQAEALSLSMPHVGRIAVVGIDCVPSEQLAPRATKEPRAA